MNIIEKNNTKNFAPIVLFTYNRPDHTRQTVEYLAMNEYANESVLFVYSDGPKNEQAVYSVQQVRAYLKDIKGFKSVTVIERNKNWGLAKSIIDGVTSIVNKYGKVIVLEDDIITSPFFLKYMNDGLNIYENEKKVASIHAYQYPISPKGLPFTFFIKGADCQGWATWDTKWALFEKDTNKLLNYILDNNLQYEFDIQGTYPYTQMLKSQIEGKVDSWAIRWYASAFINDKYTLYPNISIIYNIGFDNSGIHSSGIDNFNNKKWNNKKPVVIEKVKYIENNKIALKRWKGYFNKYKRNIIIRIIRRILIKKNMFLLYFLENYL
jgi:hypothetical protein